MLRDFLCPHKTGHGGSARLPPAAKKERYAALEEPLKTGPDVVVLGVVLAVGALKTGVKTQIRTHKPVHAETVVDAGTGEFFVEIRPVNRKLLTAEEFMCEAESHIPFAAFAVLLGNHLSNEHIRSADHLEIEKILHATSGCCRIFLCAQNVQTKKILPRGSIPLN